MADYYVATTGSDTTGNGSSGNPWATPGKAIGEAIAAGGQWNIYVKEGAYALSTSTANVSGGRLNFLQSGSTTAINRVIGYSTTINDGGKFTLHAQTGSNATLVTFNNANPYNEIHNAEIVGNSTSGASAINAAGRHNRIFNIYVSGFTGGGSHTVSVTSNASISFFRISGSSTANFAALNCDSGGGFCSDGIVNGNAGVGISIGANSWTLVNVISANNTGANGFGFQTANAVYAKFYGCVAYGNAQSGFRQSNTTSTADFVYCVSYGNAKYGFDYNNASAILCVNCAYGSNTQGNFNATPDTNLNAVSLLADPFVNAGGLDFTPGSVLKSKSLLWPYAKNPGLSETFADIGAIQSLAASGGCPLVGHGGLVY